MKILFPVIPQIFGLIRDNAPKSEIYSLNEKSFFQEELNRHKMTLLHLALRFEKNFELIKLIVDKKSNLNAKDKANFTPLIYACKNEKISLETISYLVKRNQISMQKEIWKNQLFILLVN